MQVDLSDTMKQDYTSDENDRTDEWIETFCSCMLTWIDSLGQFTGMGITIVTEESYL